MTVIRKTRSKKNESVKLLSIMIKQNSFVNEEDMLNSVFAGRTESIKPTRKHLNVWKHLHKSATIHFSRKAEPYKVRDYFVSFESEDNVELPEF
jgi:hypothetical protein